MISEKANVLQKEKQALRDKADLLQEESHSLQKTILLEAKINLQDQLIEALQSQVAPLTRRTNWMTLITKK